jgi:PTS system nitrogen regulatory IIA component
MPSSPRISIDQPKPTQSQMPNLADLIDQNRVIFAARASDKEQLLRDLAARAAVLLNLDAQKIFSALWAREELGSTGLGEGFALPHACIEGLDCFFGMFARLKRPINFDAIDGKPVDLVFVLLTPPAADREHLSTLATISRHLRDQGFATKLRKATSATALCNLLCDPQHS